jgi:hypothetical protein
MKENKLKLRVKEKHFKISELSASIVLDKLFKEFIQKI